MKRVTKLVLRKETLTELGTDELRAVVGGGLTHVACEITHDIVCDDLRPLPSDDCPPVPTLSGPAC